MEEFLRIIILICEEKNYSKCQNIRNPGSSIFLEKDFSTKIRHMRYVVERWKIVGLNRKLQIKPLKWDAEKKRCKEVELILKWGGNLTKLGEKQSVTLGQRLRHDLYPDAPGGGLLRLHSTFRHDLKIKTSDEGRVMKTAAAFSKGLLELEGEITPILVSLVAKERDQHMLDPSGNKEVKEELEHCKERIGQNLQRDMHVSSTDRTQLESIVGHSSLTAIHKALHSVGNPHQTLFKIRNLIGELIKQLDEMLDEQPGSDESKDQSEQETLSAIKLYKGETLLELTERWRFLYFKLYNEEKDIFDLSRIPDVHDNVRFDMLHNPHLGLTSTLQKLYELAKQMADCVVPQEYGITIEEKRSIGSKMCATLLEKIKYDLDVARTGTETDMRYMINMDYSTDLSINTLGRRIRTRLYFTSESHLHTLLNVLRFPPNQQQCPLSYEGQKMINDTSELCYLTQVVIRLFENTKKDINDKFRFRVEILFSPGATNTPLHMAEMDRDLDNSRFDTHALELISNDHLTCKDIEDYFDEVIKQGTIADADSEHITTNDKVQSEPHHVPITLKNASNDVQNNDLKGLKKQKLNENTDSHTPKSSFFNEKRAELKEVIKNATNKVATQINSQPSIKSLRNSQLSTNCSPFTNSNNNDIDTADHSFTAEDDVVSVVSDFEYDNSDDIFIIEEKIHQLTRIIAYGMLRRFAVFFSTIFIVSLVSYYFRLFEIIVLKGGELIDVLKHEEKNTSIPDL